MASPLSPLCKSAVFFLNFSGICQTGEFFIRESALSVSRLRLIAGASFLLKPCQAILLPPSLVVLRVLAFNQFSISDGR